VGGIGGEAEKLETGVTETETTSLSQEALGDHTSILINKKKISRVTAKMYK